MRQRTVELAAIAMAALMLALASGLTVAQATRTVKIASHITIKSQGLTFSGRVTASNVGCEGARKVTLYRTTSLMLGSTTTSPSGSWKITVSGSAGITLGRFYAKVKQRNDGTAGTIYSCLAARSKTIPYKP
jgi:hypothetical protein